MPCSLDTLPLPTVSDFADLAEPFYSAIKQDVLEDSSSDLLEQVDIGDRNFFDQPQRWDLSPRSSKNLKTLTKFYGYHKRTFTHIGTEYSATYLRNNKLLCTQSETY